MPRATSDFRNPVCFEMRAIRSGLSDAFGSFSYAEPPTPGKIITYTENPAVPNPIVPQNERGSVDSSGTFASCNTHPFLSQGDLTSSEVVDTNLGGATTTTGVKKSTSGDTALRSLGASPMDETFRGFGGIERGSRGSLNDSPLPKHRKTRFQQSTRQRARFNEPPEKGRFESQESLESKKASRKASFMPSRSLASATRIINQHLFGLQTLSGSRTGKNGSSKSSLSVDSIDSPQPETHRRSKSILKKSDSSGQRNGKTSEDPESERLISDNMSSMDAGSGSGSDFSPNKRLTATVSPPVRHRTFSQKAVSTKNNQQTQESEKSRALKSQLFLLDDILAGEKHQRERIMAEKYKDMSGEHRVGDVPLYICPPPPAMDEHSPTEETRLLLHMATPTPQHKQSYVNSTNKGKNQTS